MALTVKIAPTLYTSPGKEATPGSRMDVRCIALGTADLGTTTGGGTTQLIAVGILPANHLLTGVAVECASLDGSAGLVMNLGVLNTYYNQMIAGTSVTSGSTAVSANYSLASTGTSAGTANTSSFNYGAAVSDTNASPTLAQTIMTSINCVQAGGRSVATAQFTTLVGCDPNNDRILALQVTTAASIAQAGVIAVIANIDAAA